MTNLSSGGGYDYGYGGWNGGAQSYFYKKEKKASYFGNTQKPAFQIGTEVYHSRYGYGKVVAADRDNTQVLFEDGSMKNIKADYLEIA